MKNKVHNAGAKSQHKSVGSHDGFWLLLGGVTLAVGMLTKSAGKQQGLSKQPKKEGKIAILIASPFVGLLIGYAVGYFIDNQWIPALTISISLILTVLAIGTSNLYPQKPGKSKKIKLFSPTTGRVLAVLSMLGLGFSLTVGTFSETPVDPMSCSLEPTITRSVFILECGDYVAEKIDLSEVMPVADREIVFGDWKVVEALPIKKGSSIVQVLTSNDEFSCTYTRDMSALNHETTKQCGTPVPPSP